MLSFVMSTLAQRTHEENLQVSAYMGKIVAFCLIAIVVVVIVKKAIGKGKR
jgi:hypothetical protein